MYSETTKMLLKAKKIKLESMDILVFFTMIFLLLLIRLKGNLAFH
jgi:hypothetical protein